MRSIPIEIRNLNNVLKRNIETAHKNELTRVQNWIIGYIYHNNDKEIFQKNIEIELNMRRSTASEIIKNMESKGYLLRVSVDYDQRLKKLVLTDKAIQHHLKFLEFAEHFEKKLANNLTDEELEIFFKIIDKIKINLKEEEDIND